ncbi:MAG: AAA family ATPase, partial [Desulfovibrio sp.]|nr:AAA family ATPase [Desulfovibrio sp.]
AQTIHKLLVYSAEGECCERNEHNPLVCDLLIVDEASMIDVSLMNNLLNALPLGCTLILVGDIFQLPSVGPGQVLADIIASKVLPMVTLTKIFRQSAESAIVRYAHLIHEGIVPAFQDDSKKRDDFYYMEINSPQDAAETIIDLVTRRLPAYYHFDPKLDIQVLSPMHMGEVGVTELNQRLQNALNPNTDRVERVNGVFALFDKVRQIRNNYEKEVFNGDVGTITAFDTKKRILTVRFDENAIDYQFDELEELIPAYAISIHKSQGTEYPCVVIPLMSCHWWMLQRNLLYTAVTRGKKLVVLVGDRKALYQAISNKNVQKRMTSLAQRLQKMVASSLDERPNQTLPYTEKT